MDTPKLRFKGFDQPWKEDIIGNLFSERIERDANGEMLSVSMRNGVIKASDNGKADSSSEDKSHYKVVKINDIPYNTMRMWQGACGSSKYDGIVSPAYTVLTPHENINSGFFAQSFRTFKTLKVFKKYSQGLSSDNWNLKFDTIKLISTLFPENPLEQKLIISFIQDLDRFIDIYNSDVLRLTHTKAASMVSMFPQNEEPTPRVRFKGFDEPWETIKARKLFKTFNERNRPDLPVLSAFQDNRGMAFREDSGYSISHDIRNEATYKHVLPGQFVMHLRSFQGGFAHSSVEGITSPAYTVFGFIDEDSNYDYFWKLIFMSKAFIKRLETITYGIRDGRSISFDEFLNLSFLVPSKAEQQKIAEFFQNLDRQIECQTQILERLKRAKAACLDQLFV